MQVIKGEKTTTFVDGDKKYVLPNSAIITVKDESGMVNIRLIGSRKNILSYNE